MRERAPDSAGTGLCAAGAPEIGPPTAAILRNRGIVARSEETPLAALSSDPVNAGDEVVSSEVQARCGVVFELAPETGGKWKYNILHRFTGADGWVPQASLIFDKGYKHLYGTTTEGGPGNYGVVFEITP